MKHKRTFIIVACVAILLTASSFAYRKTIVVMYGQIPEAWSPDFAGMTFGQIYQEIGYPQISLSAKGHQLWIIKQWWGWKMLRMGLQDCCPLTSEPDNIDYIVYVNFWYNPAYIKTIRHKEVKIEDRPRFKKIKSPRFL